MAEAGSPPFLRMRHAPVQWAVEPYEAVPTGQLCAGYG